MQTCSKFMGGSLDLSRFSSAFLAIETLICLSPSCNPSIASARAAWLQHRTASKAIGELAVAVVDFTGKHPAKEIEPHIRQSRPTLNASLLRYWKGRATIVLLEPVWSKATAKCYDIRKEAPGLCELDETVDCVVPLLPEE